MGGYNPNYYRRMLNGLGALGTAKRLLSADKHSEATLGYYYLTVDYLSFPYTKR